MSYGKDYTGSTREKILKEVYQWHNEIIDFHGTTYLLVGFFEDFEDYYYTLRDKLGKTIYMSCVGKITCLRDTLPRKAYQELKADFEPYESDHIRLELDTANIERIYSRKNISEDRAYKYIEELLEKHQALQTQMDKMDLVIGDNPEHPLRLAIKELMLVAIDRTSYSVNDYSKHIQWFIFDNNMGKNGLTQTNELYDIQDMPVNTVEELIDLIGHWS